MFRGTNIIYLSAFGIHYILTIKNGFILRGPKKTTRSKSLSVNQAMAISMLFLALPRCATIFSFMRSVSNMGIVFLLFLLNFFDILIGITIFSITNIQNNFIQNSRFCKKRTPQHFRDFETIHKILKPNKIRFCARFARAKGGEMVHFSGYARKMNHIPLPRTSKASARTLI